MTTGDPQDIPPPRDPHAGSLYAMWHDPSAYDPLVHGPPYLPESKVRMASTERDVVQKVARPLIQKMAADEMTEIQAAIDQVKADFGPTPMSELAALLAFLRAEALVHQSHHWQTRGETYFGDHLLFERLYGEVNGQIDGLAERMVGSGHHILAHPILLAKHCSMVVQTFYRDAGANPSADVYPVLSLRSVLRTMVALKLVYTRLDEGGQLSHGTDNLLQGMADKHEELVYLLKQRTNTKTATATQERTVESKVSLPVVEIDGVRCKWQQAQKQTGRSAIGSAPQRLRGWWLNGPEGHLIASLRHTHDLPSYVPPKEPPAWFVHVRVGSKDYTLKGRWADPDSQGDENLTPLKAAAEAAVRAYMTLRAKEKGDTKTASTHGPRPSHWKAG